MKLGQAEPKNYDQGQGRKSEAEPSQAKPDSRRGKAKARQAEKLLRGRLEPRQLARGLHL